MGYLGDKLEDYYSYQLIDEVIKRLLNKKLEEKEIKTIELIERYKTLKKIIEG